MRYMVLGLDNIFSFLRASLQAETSSSEISRLEVFTDQLQKSEQNSENFPADDTKLKVTRRESKV